MTTATPFSPALQSVFDFVTRIFVAGSAKSFANHADGSYVVSSVCSGVVTRYAR